MEAKELHPQETFWFLKLDDLKVIVSWNLYISYLVIATPSPSIFLQVFVLMFHVLNLRSGYQQTSGQSNNDQQEHQ